MYKKIKQAVAIIIAIAFVGSIVFLIPKASNNNLFSFAIIAPTQILHNYTVFQSFNQNLSIITSIPSTEVGNLILGTNATDLLTLEEFMLKSSGFDYSPSKGNIMCVSGSHIPVPLCTNQTYQWVLFESVNNGNYTAVSGAQSSIVLENIYTTTSYILLYEKLNLFGLSGGGNTPPPPGQ